MFKVDKNYILGSEETLAQLTFEKGELVAFDFETTGLDHKTLVPLLLAIETKKLGKFVFRVCHMDKNEITSFFKRNQQAHWIAANTMYDAQIVKEHYAVELENVSCVLVNERILRNGWKVKFSYASLVERYSEHASELTKAYGIEIDTSVDITKATRIEFITMQAPYRFTEEQLQYAANDTHYLIPIYLIQQQLIDKYELRETEKIESAFIKVLAYELHYNGINFNLDKLQSLIDEWENSKIGAMNNIKNAVLFLNSKKSHVLGKPLLEPKKKKGVDPNTFSLFTDAEMYSPTTVLNNINFDSPKQMLVLFKRLQFNIDKTDEPTLVKLKNKLKVTDSRYDFIVKLLEYRKIQKNISTYGYKFFELRHKLTGKWYPQYKQVFTATGRLSSHKFNVQNLPKPVRKCVYEPDSENYCFVTLDLSGQELRIAASQSQDELLLKSFNEGLDLHSELASNSYKVINNDESFTISKQENAELRDKHKPVLFGWIYGAGSERFSAILDISKSLGQKVFNRLKKTLPLLDKYQTGIKKAIKTEPFVRDGSFTNRLKWIRHYNCPPTPDWKLEQEMCNYPIQSSGASMIKHAMNEVRNYMIANNKDWKILITVHDEITVRIPFKRRMVERQLPERWNRIDADETDALLLKNILEESGNKFLNGVKMESESVIDFIWDK